jgi:hypothetical protein
MAMPGIAALIATALVARDRHRAGLRAVVTWLLAGPRAASAQHRGMPGLLGIAKRGNG